MEEVRGSNRLGRVKLKTQHQLPTYTQQELPDAFWTGRNGYTRREPPSLCCQSLDVLGSPISAMEYLSRSWSPAASDFLSIFSSNNLLIPLEDSCFQGKPDEELNEGYKTGDHDGESETAETKESTFLCDVHTTRKHAQNSESNRNNRSQSKQSAVSRVDSLRMLFAIERPHPAVYKKHPTFDLSRLNLKDVKGWLTGKPLASLLKWYKDRKKEELRLHRAKVDAALSVARLAAAIAGITGNSIVGVDDITCHNSSSMVAYDNNMGNVLSFAASLVAAVCAEAAESAGAPRDQVASAINSGFANQTPADMITLTATAATCLRGAATLRSRTIVNSYLEETEELLNSGTAMPVVTPSGQKRQRLVSVHLKHRQPLLTLTRKYFGAVLTSKEYRILDMSEEVHEARGYFLLSLQTEGGDIKLLFCNEDQAIVWISAISNCLHLCSLNNDNVKLEND
ncbi:VAN3-binding protein-like [Syzygium oleosum]|uniref:VAN3-binding protein-like n=1 Tax=Syzygium oleosum TaxID=219896 RepID=UPI0024B92323|nr:VAN3-binding protein-like [Syzygium oleosum]